MKDVKSELNAINKIINEGHFKDEWTSLEDYKIPKWYKDEKFGIFIHWGVYSVPAFGNEWYPRQMYIKDSNEFKHHKETWGDHSKFGYKDFIPMFKAEKFDPDYWAELFSKAGARFVVPVAEHHDGFAMYDCRYSEWCSAKMGPKRDIVGELAKSVRKKNMIFGLSSHRAEHWWFFDGGMQFDSDVKNGSWHGLYGPARSQNETPDEAFLNDWLLRTCELIDKYQPQIVWFDWWIEMPIFEPYLRKLSAYYYNRSEQWNLGVGINYKNRSFVPETAIYDVERGQLSDIRPILWQTDTSISKNSWGYIEGHDYKDAGDIVLDLIDIISKNGVLLLNIGPRPDGTIPEPEQEILLEIGNWLRLNGEAVYGTRPWKVFGEGPTEVVSGMFTDTKRSPFTSQDIRFTDKGDMLYAIMLNWADSRQVNIKTLAKGLVNSPYDIACIELLGSDSKIDWSRDENGLLVNLPSEKPCKYAYVLKIKKKYS